MSFLVRLLEVCVVGVSVLTVYYALTTPTVLCLAALAVLWGVYRRERRRAAGTIPLTGRHVLITGWTQVGTLFFLSFTHLLLN